MGYNIDGGEQVQAADLEQVYRAAGPYAASSTGNDSYAITVTPAVDTLEAGMVFRFKADVANTAAATLNVNGKGAKTIKKWGSGGKKDLSTGDIQANQFVTVIYDGTHMLMLSAQQPRPLYATGQASRAHASGTGTQNIAHGLGVTPRLIVIKAVGKTTSNLTHSISHGTATSTSDESCTGAYYGTGSGVFQNNDHIIMTVNSLGGAAWSATVSSIDDTNITLDFDTASAGETLYFQWEAYA